jgi:hypothetical protein
MCCDKAADCVFSVESSGLGDLTPVAGANTGAKK